MNCSTNWLSLDVTAWLVQENWHGDVQPCHDSTSMTMAATVQSSHTAEKDVHDWYCLSVSQLLQRQNWSGKVTLAKTEAVADRYTSETGEGGLAHNLSVCNLCVSVESFFSQANWLGKAVATTNSGEVVVPASLRLTLSVEQFWQEIDWHGPVQVAPQPITPAKTAPSEPQITLTNFADLF